MRLRTRKDSKFTVVVEDVELTGTPLSMRERTRVTEKYTKKKSKGGRLDEKTDWASVNGEIFDRTVSSWKNAVDEDGKELPCDSETKLRIANLNPAFSQDVVDAFDRAGSEVDDDDGKKGKASSSAG